MRTTILAVVLSIGLSGLAPAGAVDERVRSASLATYFHGMTAEIADREVGAAGVPALLELLADPTFSRRDNVVAFLTYLGDDEASDALVGFLRRPPAPVRVPEEDRSLLLAPRALGHIAARGHGRALDALLDMTEHGRNGGVLAAAAARSSRPAALRDDLLESALQGLAASGSAAAGARLDDIAAGRVVPASGGRDLRGAAREARERFHGGTSEPAGASSGEWVGGAAFDGGDESVASMEVGAAMDTQTGAHDTRLDYANHVSVTSKMSDTRLDQVLALASTRVGRTDFTADVACCVEFHRKGNGLSFGNSGDGLDVLDNETELTTVLNHSVSRMKVVRQINWCGSPGTNIIGCAWIGGKGGALVRLSTLESEGVLWVHEYGHNVGLGHNTTSGEYIMYGVDYGTNRAVDQTECNKYHAPVAASQPDVVSIGTCSDSDADAVVTNVDNCPTVANTSQTDADGDGLGDACESACGNGVRDGAEQCDGANLGSATCASLGYDSGTLACRGDCTFDTSGCSDCGNGVREGGEECDGADRGGASCLDRQCTSGTPSCTASCTLDYASCGGCPACDNDGLCDGNESCQTCGSDCISGSGASCGNGVCEPGSGEDCLSCPQDCAGRQTGRAKTKYCCGDGAGVKPVTCADARCTANGFQCTSGPAASYCCGDDACTGIENSDNCAVDCGAPPPGPTCAVSGASCGAGSECCSGRCRAFSGTCQ